MFTMERHPAHPPRVCREIRTPEELLASLRLRYRAYARTEGMNRVESLDHTLEVDADVFDEGLMRWWERRHRRFRFLVTYTRQAPSEGFLTGRIPSVLPAQFPTLADHSVFIAGNPDFVAYARSFGMAAFRPASAADLYPTLKRALDVAGPSLVEVPIDYAENLRLTEHLGALSGSR